MNALMRDTIEARALAFWMRGWVSGGWPLEAKGQTFLGNAIHAIGTALYPEWTGREPVEHHLPRFEDGRYYSSLGYAEDIAIQWLVADDPTLAVNESFWSEINANIAHIGTRLSDEMWMRVREIYRRDYHDRFVESSRKMNAVMHVTAAAAAREELSFFTRSATGEYEGSPMQHWQSEGCYVRFYECQMNPAAPDRMILPSLEEIIHRQSSPQLLPGNHWIYVTSESLQTFLGTLIQARPQPIATAEQPARDEPLHEAPRTAFKLLVEGKIKASPYRKTASIAELVQAAAHLGLKEYAAKEIRKVVIGNIADKRSKKAWQRPGAKSKDIK